MRKWWLLVGAVLVVAVGATLRFRQAGPPPLPQELTAPAGSQLPDGFSVPQGAVRLGPVLRLAADTDGRFDGWLVVLAVTGRPLDAWGNYLRQLAARAVTEASDPRPGKGCRIDGQNGFRCDLEQPVAGAGSEGARLVTASLRGVEGDVTGRYLLVLTAGTSPAARPGVTQAPVWTRRTAPPPPEARESPSVGDPLAPATTAYPGDDRRYVLLEGSELIAQWGSGSLTGGFDVLLRVLPGSEPEEVGEAYSRQAAQFEGETLTSRLESEGTRYTRYQPPGGAGGYQGTVWVVDQPGVRDYVFYSLVND